MKYNALLFDFDGTITESGLGITRSAAYAFEQMGLPMPAQEELETFIGPPLITSFMKYGNLDEAGGIKATGLFRERYHKIGWKENRVYAGIAPLLKALKKQGVYLAIASAKPEHLVRLISDHFDIARYFDKIVGATYETTHADKIDLLRAALPESYDPARTAMVGDRLFDMEAGKQLGITSIGVAYGYGSREELESSGADIICDTVDALHELLLPGVEKERGLAVTFGCEGDERMHLLEKHLNDRGYEAAVMRADAGRAAIACAVKNGKIVLCDAIENVSFADEACKCEPEAGFIRQINVPAMSAAANCGFDEFAEAVRAEIDALLS